MFICDYCSRPTGPNIKPIIVVLPDHQYAVSYRNSVMDPETEQRYIKQTVGHEHTQEFKQCPECATGQPYTAPAKQDISKAIAVVVGMQSHARNCKKPLEECRWCKANLETYRHTPLDVLSAAASEKQVKPLTEILGRVVVHNAAYQRVMDNTQRAALDVAATYSLVAPHAGLQAIENA